MRAISSPIRAGSRIGSGRCWGRGNNSSGSPLWLEPADANDPVKVGIVAVEFGSALFLHQGSVVGIGVVNRQARVEIKHTAVHTFIGQLQAGQVDQRQQYIADRGAVEVIKALAG